jgi:hypothetical protein
MGAILLTFTLFAFFALRAVPSVSVDGKVKHHHATTTAVAGVTTTTTLGRSQVRVQVANGTKTAGLAAAVTARLMTQGWNMLPKLNGPRVGHTAIYYKSGYASQAVLIRQFLGAGTLQLWTGAAPVPGALDDQIIVLLGPDIAH